VKRLWLRISIFLISISLIFVVSEKIWAEDSNPPPAVTVSSIYWDAILKSWGNETAWVFAPSGTSQEDNGYTMEVKREGEEAPLVLLQYASAGKLQGVTRLLREHGRTRRIAKVSADKLVLSEGFPVPYDYLAPDDMDLSTARIKKEGGGAVFSYEAAREIREFSFDQALEDGLIRGEIKDRVLGKNLKWIAVTKGGGAMVRQLWAEGLPWWVYEETPYRKSWLVEISMEH